MSGEGCGSDGGYSIGTGDEDQALRQQWNMQRMLQHWWALGMMVMEVAVTVWWQLFWQNRDVSPVVMVVQS